MEQIVSKWTDRIARMRVGWTIRLRNGKLAVITWIADNHESYTAKEIEEANRGGEQPQQ